MMMIHDGFAVRNIIYMIAVMQTAIAPLAFVYHIYYLTTAQPLFSTHISIIDSLLDIWLKLELIFYIYFQVTWNRMQSLLPPVKPGVKARRRLFHNTINNISDIDDWITGWFLKPNGHPPCLQEICRENLAEWVAWAFFAKPLETVLEDAEETDQVQWMTDAMISKFCLELEPGYDEDIRALRITLDPVQAYHRPLIFYMCMTCITFMIHHVLFEQFWKMQHYQCGHVSYWLRSGGAADNKKPIVFIHGIGPGFLPYLLFLYNLLQQDDGASDVFCVELPHVSMRCVEQAPTMHQTVRDLRFMLAHHGYRDAVFVAHSLGTGLVSWVLQHSPKTVAGVVMLDPICFMLHYKDVCYNFVYRVPKTASEYIVKFFASTELYISYYISRHFHWFQLALYVTPSYLANSPYASTTTITMPRNTKIFLSEHDNIVHSERVHDYLVTIAIDSTMMEGLDHGWFLLRSSWQSEIMAAIKEFASNV